MPKYDLTLSTPILNAAGSLGFAPAADGPLDLSRLGAFITNPVSLARRTPAQEPRCLPFPGGFLLHTGYPNPGLKAVLRRYTARWARSPLPVWVHLLASRPEEAAGLVRRLERVEGVAGLELGLPPGLDPEGMVRFAEAAAGELPLVVRLPLELAWELAGASGSFLSSLVNAGAGALSLAPPRGALPGPQGQPVRGRLYGPAVFPLALAAVQSLAGRGLPLIAAGGVYTQQQAQAMLDAGALAVQLDSVLWRGGI